MIDSELENISKHGDSNRDKNSLLQEYDEVVETLKKDLTMCKTEQNKIRSALEALRNDSRDTGDLVKDHFSRVHVETCSSESIHNKELIMNLQERLAVLQMEKDSVFQLWQIALKTVGALEEELKSFRSDGKSSKLYEEHIDNVKETYSEAIKALEGKLLQARENFLKQQALWETSKDKIEDLLKEKTDVTRKYEALQKDTLEKDRNSMRMVETLKTELAAAKADTQRAVHLKEELESKLNEAMKFTASLIARNEETKNKMSEALELVEIAVREKDLISQREAHVSEEKGRLELRLSKITEEHTVMLQEEITKIKDGYERSGKKYTSEIKELKAELRQKTVLLDNVQKDYRVSQEELEKVRQNSEDVLQKSRTKILDFEQKLHCVERQLRDSDDTQRKKYNAEIGHLESKVIELEEKLNAANDKLRKMQQENRDSMEHQDGPCTNVLATQIHTVERETKKLGSPVTIENKEHCCRLLLLEQTNKAQERYDRKIKELSHHVEVHQKLSKKWKEEAKSMTTKFQEKSKEHRAKINALRKENEELNKQLFSCRQELTKHKIQSVPRCSEGNKVR
ncbi:sodium channel and clathrin linker 1-like isoform X2 [Vespula pensylvanica]|uniref:sodium channel and clathrin linker 1-like isoform X2 n=1 Tax=Vespula pensylvanica TaxID=30213 RepID=UPI001CBA1CFB|nr:sodium channel and clathrin linker 1-like isoform X2 [Vespula pensylvanica]